MAYGKAVYVMLSIGRRSRNKIVSASCVLLGNGLSHLCVLVWIYLYCVSLCASCTFTCSVCVCVCVCVCGVRLWDMAWSSWMVM